MKRNDFAVFLVYVAMFALALLVGLFGIQQIAEFFSFILCFLYNKTEEY